MPQGKFRLAATVSISKADDSDWENGVEIDRNPKKQPARRVYPVIYSSRSPGKAQIKSTHRGKQYQRRITPQMDR